ncbi:MAG TPA: CerR family C-terminal domain-containing protein [Syntrophorhabdaceae bacterium]|nr:CerR family C-terminal domain-containing protein [Syntrophorhabdaceae bacterium]
MAIGGRNYTTQGTKERILEAAGEVFVAHGFQSATVREICRKAGVNIAAVNYHFRNKENLYLATLRYCREISFKKYPVYPDMRESELPEERLRSFVHSFVFRVLEEGKASRFAKLVAKEYVQPSKALDVLVKETMRPAFTRLFAIVRQLAGKGPDDETVRYCCMSIVGQFLFFLYARPVLKRLFGKASFKAEEIAAIAEHITLFSLHAIRGLKG